MGIDPNEILGAALGMITALLEFIRDEGYNIDAFMQEVALSILTGEDDDSAS
jgi:hypothetical protein